LIREVILFPNYKKKSPVPKNPDINQEFFEQ